MSFYSELESVVGDPDNIKQIQSTDDGQENTSEESQNQPGIFDNIIGKIKSTLDNWQLPDTSDVDVSGFDNPQPANAAESAISNGLGNVKQTVQEYLTPVQIGNGYQRPLDSDADPSMPNLPEQGGEFGTAMPEEKRAAQSQQSGINETLNSIAQAAKQYLTPEPIGNGYQRPLDSDIDPSMPNLPEMNGEQGTAMPEEERTAQSQQFYSDHPYATGVLKGAVSGVGNMLAGAANDFGWSAPLEGMDRVNASMQRPEFKSYTSMEYFTNPMGLAFDIGAGLGSAAAIAGTAALFPEAVVGTGTGAITRGLSRIGLQRAATSKVGQEIITNFIKTSPASFLDAASRYGSTINDMVKNGESQTNARLKAFPVFVKALGVDMATIPVEYAGMKGATFGNLTPTASESIAQRAALAVPRAVPGLAANAAIGGLQQVEQQGIQNNAMGQPSGDLWNPDTWTPDQVASFFGGAYGGAAMGIPGGVLSRMVPKTDTVSGNQTMQDTQTTVNPNTNETENSQSATEPMSSMANTDNGQMNNDQATRPDSSVDVDTLSKENELSDYLDNIDPESIGEDNYNTMFDALRSGDSKRVNTAYDMMSSMPEETSENEEDIPMESVSDKENNSDDIPVSSDNSNVGIIEHAANNAGIDPKVALAVAAVETGGGDVNAIKMSDGGGMFQIEPDTDINDGNGGRAKIADLYPDYQTDPKQNAEAGMAVLKDKIANDDGDLWKGVQDYNGGGDDEYLSKVQNAYDNLGGTGEFDTESNDGLSAGTEAWIGQSMENGANGCVEAVGKIGSFYDPFLAEESKKGVDNVDTLVKDAGDRVVPFSEDNLQKGDVIVYGDDDHVVLYDGDGGYIGNSTSQGKIIHGDDYNKMGGLEPTKIIKTSDTSGTSTDSINSDSTQDNIINQFDKASRQDEQADQKAMNDIVNDDTIDQISNEMAKEEADIQRQENSNPDEKSTLDAMFKGDQNNSPFIDTQENIDTLKNMYGPQIDAMTAQRTADLVLNSLPDNSDEALRDSIKMAGINGDLEAIRNILQNNPQIDLKNADMNTIPIQNVPTPLDLADNNQVPVNNKLRQAVLESKPLAVQTLQDKLKKSHVPDSQIQNALKQQQEDTPSSLLQKSITPKPLEESTNEPFVQDNYLNKKEQLMQHVPTGNVTSVHANTLDKGFNATYKLVPSGDLITSNLTDYSINPKYPIELQPRDRQRGEMRNQVEKMARTIKPELLSDSQFVNQGAPVVNKNGIVLNGNGRTIAIQRAYEGQDRQHKISAAGYKQYLKDNANKFGFTSGQVQAIDNPILVRQVDKEAPIKDIIHSTEGGARLGSAEQAQMDANKLKLSTMNKFVDDGTGEFLNPGNREFRKLAARDIKTEDDSNAIYNDKHEVTPYGVSRIKNAMFAKAYHDNALLAKMSESTDNNSKNILKAMIIAAPDVAKVNYGIDHGTLYKYDISKVMSDASKVLMSLRDAKKPLNFYLKETSLFDASISPEERAILEFVDANKFSTKKISEVYKTICNKIMAVGDPHQAELFGTERPSLENIIERSINEVNNNGQKSLFEQGRENSKETNVGGTESLYAQEHAGNERLFRQENSGVEQKNARGTTGSTGELRLEKQLLKLADDNNIPVNNKLRNDVLANKPLAVQTLQDKLRGKVSTDKQRQPAYDDVQKEIDSMEDALANKYGEDSVIHMGLGDDKDIIPVSSQQKLNALYDQRNGIWENETNAGVGAVVNNIRNDGPVPTEKVADILQNYAHQNKLSISMEGRPKKISYNDFFKDIYGRLANWMVYHSSDNFPEAFLDMDTAQRAAGDFQHSIYGRNPEDVLKQAKNITDTVFKGENNEINRARLGGQAVENTIGNAQSDQAEKQKNTNRENKINNSKNNLETKIENEQSKTTKIEDFGEKIGGARKDIYTSYKKELDDSDKIDTQTKPLSKSFPEPKYDALIKAGADKHAIALVHALRDSISNKPRRDIKYWAQGVDAVKKMAQMILDGKGDEIEKRLYSSGHKGIRDVVSNAKLYEAVGHAHSLKEYTLSEGTYSMYDGKEYNPPKHIWEIVKAQKGQVHFHKTVVDGDTEQQVIDKFKKQYDSIMGDNADNTTKQSFGIYINRGTKEYEICKKIGNRVVLMKDGFKNVKDAVNYRDNHATELEEQLKQMKYVPNERREANEQRVGTNYRKGKDVTPEIFGKAFGFRGVEFGNWVEGKRRQSDLNNAYDSLRDMANIIDVDPEALSLNGQLGLAFGARGIGGKHPAAAHYEPLHNVINLTKNEGAGSLAHEWLHALDYFFGTKRKKDEFLSTASDVRLAAQGSKYYSPEGIRPEIVKKWGDIRKAIYNSGMVKRAEALDQYRSKPYWSKPEELYARAFESYIVDKLKERGESDDYLANIVPASAWEANVKGDREKGYPYVQPKEMPEIRKAFDAFFDTVEQEKTDKGITLYQVAGQNHMIPTNHPEVKRAYDDVAAEVKRAFPAGEFSQDGNLINVDMPNGKRIVVDIKNQIIRNGKEIENAKLAHGVSPKSTISLEGAWRETSLDHLSGLMELSQSSREGTVYHEAFHAAWDMALTRREKDAMLNHYDPIAKKQGVNVNEVMADAFSKYAGMAKPQGIFGKLYHKLIDFANKIKVVLTGTENVHNVMRKIKTNEVWKSEGEQADYIKDEDYSVTNKNITGDTRVPVIDVTDQPKVNVKNNQEKVAIAKSLIGKTFTIIGSEGTGRVASVSDGRHLINSSNLSRQGLATRGKALSVIKNILNNTIYVEKHIDDRHSSGKPYIELFSVVKDGNKLVRFRIVAKEGDKNANQFTIRDAKFYDMIQQKGDVSPSMPQMGMQGGKISPLNTVSVAELLRGVNDREGKPYVNTDGTLNYDVRILGEQKSINQDHLDIKTRDVQEQHLNQDIAKWNNVVDAYDKADKQVWKENNNGRLYRVMDMPLVLQMISKNDKELSVYGSFFEHVLQPKHYGMTTDIIRQLPKAIADPVMVFKTADVNKFVLALELKTDQGASVVVPVQLEKNDNAHHAINVLNTAYARTKQGSSTPNYNWFAANLKAGKLIYANKTKALDWVRAIKGDTLVGPALSSALSNQSILTERDLVNMRNENAGQYSIRENNGQSTNDKSVTPDDITKAVNAITPAGKIKNGFDLSKYGRLVAQYVDDKLKLRSNAELIHTALNQLKGQNLTPLEARREGVSIFGSKYFTDPDLVKEEFPNYYKAFEKSLDNDPALKSKIDNVKSLIDQYQQQNNGMTAFKQRTSVPVNDSNNPLKNLNEQDIKPAVQSVKDTISDGIKDIKDTLAPATAGENAKTMANIMRENLSEMAQKADRAENALHTARSYFSKQSSVDNLDFVNRIETGRGQSTPELQKFAYTLRKMLDERRVAIQQLGTGKLQDFIVNYFPHMWEDPNHAGNLFAAWAGRRPFEGGKSFLKKRSIPTTKQGIESGLKPVSDNPVDIAMLKMREMDKYIMAHNVINEAKARGLTKYIKATSKDIPYNWERIDDRIATVYGAPVDVTGKPIGGLHIRGYYYMPKEAARLINNYLSPGLRTHGRPMSGLYRSYLGAANILNQFQLGLSAFHLGFTSMDATVSKVALGFLKVSHGDIGSGLKDFFHAPIAPVENALRGNKVLKEWYTPGTQGAEVAKLADALVASGGRVQMDKFYRTGMWDKMSDAFNAKNYLGGVWRIPFAIMDKATKPIMEYIVPRQKLGVWADAMRYEMTRKPNMTRDEMRQIGGKIWNSVDNRMGQLAYVNLFWNKTLKDLTMASVRSVGWNLGTFRELGGAGVDTVEQMNNLLHGRHPEMTYKMSYALALPITVGLVGAVTQYLYTGQTPQSIKDLYYPQTGMLDQNGKTQRVELPSYMKDLYAYYDHPGRTLVNKLHPMLSMIASMLENKDFYGTKIYNEDDNMLDKIGEMGKYVLSQFVPYSLQGGKRQADLGGDFLSKALPFVGVTPAPSDVNKSPLERRMSELVEARMPAGAKTQAQSDKSDLKRSILRDMQENGGKPTSSLADAYRNGDINRAEYKTLLRKGRLTPLERSADALSMQDLQGLLPIADETERPVLDRVLQQKIRHARSRGIYQQ
ncbi:LPD5 domain-containing protein [Megasphaera paucivorans]|uniref:Transglycosylase SLT domain-containing protein n=1 Tax=Megasphaera paucivorans TaxID=349095 RepID=A0A1G9QBQ5_9FIRM|nr:LPD5 domain-containing protein [Megasphaera paucivorans]SDM07887.1 Transglycosylase SLT domain-containing protein [Megasphaera paucivorans]